MRPIDAEQIGLNDMEIIMCDGDYKKALEMLIDKIANASILDAVPVVRCKDCKHRPTEDSTPSRLSRFDFPDDKCPCQCDDPWYDYGPADDWFCANGERNEEC